MLFLERLAHAGRVALKASATMESSSSLRVGIDTSSTMVELLCIGDAPCKSHPTYKVNRPSATPVYGAAAILNPGTRELANTLRDCCQTLTVARGRTSCVRLLRWRLTKRKGTAVSVSPDKKREWPQRRGRKSSRQTR